MGDSTDQRPPPSEGCASAGPFLSSGASRRRSPSSPLQRMSRAEQDDLPWPPPVHRPSRAELAAPATQIVRDREDYLGQGAREVGRRLTDDQVELFVSGDAPSALQQQFDRVAPEYIALHDVGTSATLRLLGALAG